MNRGTEHNCWICKDEALPLGGVYIVSLQPSHYALIPNTCEWWYLWLWLLLWFKIRIVFNIMYLIHCFWKGAVFFCMTLFFKKLTVWPFVVNEKISSKKVVALRSLIALVDNPFPYHSFLCTVDWAQGFVLHLGHKDLRVWCWKRNLHLMC